MSAPTPVWKRSEIDMGWGAQNCCPCDGCGKNFLSNQLSWCARCHSKRYCSRKCQTDAWKGRCGEPHKLECARMATARRKPEKASAKDASHAAYQRFQRLERAASTRRRNGCSRPRGASIPTQDWSQTRTRPCSATVAAWTRASRSTSESLPSKATTPCRKETARGRTRCAVLSPTSCGRWSSTTAPRRWTRRTARTSAWRG
mmetsp:Transcript_2533/g.7508  ORF Transcript_2533/g.7508 Transcript_2533/m.7508 type:complete len:202 (-) Transcript_2533:18-623(-)